MTAPTLPDWLPGLDAAITGYADRKVQAATAPLVQQNTSLQAQLAAAQAQISGDRDQLAAALQQLAGAQSKLAALAATEQADRATIADDQTTIAALQSALAQATGGTKAPAPPAGYVVAAQDDFSGSSLNGNLWSAADNDSASNELSLRLAANVALVDDHLTIRALRQTVGSHQFTSGYVSNIGKAAGVIPFGKWLIRARWTDLYGLWPALWLRFAGGAGEIDIMEAVGGWHDLAETVHQNTSGTQDKSGTAWAWPAGWSPSDWHVYGLERQADGTLVWTLDGTVTKTSRPTDKDNQGQPETWLTGPTFLGGLTLRMNVQVGGSMPASVLPGLDVTKILPAGTAGALDVDYVQVLAPVAA